MINSLKGAIVLGGLSASLSWAAPAPWLEVKSPHFTVVTNAGEREGRRTAWQFEQIRQALLVIWPWANIDGGRPLVIFAARDEASLKSLGPQYWEGKRFRPSSFWVSAADREYVAIRVDLPEPDDIGSNPYQGAYFSYVNLVFQRSLPVAAPAWYSRGVAEVLSNTFVRAKELHVGRLIQDNLQRVREGALVPFDEFLSATRGSKWLTQDGDIYLFDAQAWAFVHYLMFGEKGIHSGKVGQFNKLMYEGTSAAAALKEAFGDMTPYYGLMRAYITRSLFPYAKINVDLNVKAEGFVSRFLSLAESAQSRAHMLVAMGRGGEARAFAAEALAKDPASPAPDEVEGALLDREGKRDEAMGPYAKAVERGSKRGYIYFRLAQLTMGGVKPEMATIEKAESFLQKTIEYEPSFANGFSYLAQMKTDLDHPMDAILLAQKAIKLEPNQSYHRVTLARALWYAGRHEESVTTAQGAVSVADSPQERDSAQRFLDFARRSSPPPASRPSPQPGPSGTPMASPSKASSTLPEPPLVRIATGDSVSKCFADKDNAACARAQPLLQEACDRHDGLACRSLGSLFDGGFGIPVDKMRAAAAYDAGCRVANDKSSCARYAVLQAQGLGVQQSTAEAMDTLTRLCGEEVDDACIGWALLLTSRPQGQDLAKARSLLQATCDRKSEEACRILKSLPGRP